MKIETKYDIGQEVWYHFGGTIANGYILGIRISQGNPIIYEVSVIHTYCFMTEEDLFPSKEELLKSLRV